MKKYFALAALSFGCSSANFEIGQPEEQLAAVDSETGVSESAVEADSGRVEGDAGVDSAPGRDTGVVNDTGSVGDSGAVVVDSALPDSGSGTTTVSLPSSTASVCPSYSSGSCVPALPPVYTTSGVWMDQPVPERTTPVHKVTIEVLIDDRITGSGCNGMKIEWTVAYNMVALGWLSFTTEMSPGGVRKLSGSFTSTTAIASPASLIVAPTSRLKDGCGSWAFVAGGKAVLE